MEVDDNATDFTDLRSRSDDASRRFCLLVDHGDADDVALISLSPGKAVVVGREADLSIGDNALSRRHARFSLDPGGEVVQVEDLGSTNGTWVNGSRIEHPTTVGVADKVALGPVAVTLHAVSAPVAQLQGLETHDRFQSMLEYEVERARTFERKVALLMIQSLPPAADLVARWCPRVRRQLRPIDRLALYGASTVEVLVPEATAEQAQQLAEAIIARRPDEPMLQCGVALFPDGAASAEELIELGRSALRGAAAISPVCTVASREQRLLLAQQSSAGEEGDRPVVVSPAMIDVYRTVDRLARSAIPVLILGETGTGKEVVAHAIHDRGPRSDKPMLPVNCGAIPEALLESVLFGHRRGAFTGADRAAEGVFVAANGGSVFLDEIGELSQAAQVALLRVLEAKVVVPVGDTRETPVDVRIIAATHRDLEQMCEAGSFRWDLLYRLNTMVLEVPPLRDRPEEIRPLAQRFLRQANADSGGSQPVEGIAREALEALRRYEWPGNVRQLRNVIERAVAIAPAPVISPSELPERVRHATPRTSAPTPVQPDPVPRPVVASPPAAEPADDRPPQGLREQIQRYSVALIRIALAEAGGSRADAAERLELPHRTLSHKVLTLEIGRLPADPEGDRRIADRGPSAQDVPSFKTRVERFEHDLLRETLARHGGNQTRAAAELALPLRTLRHKISKYQLK